MDTWIASVGIVMAEKSLSGAESFLTGLQNRDKTIM